MKCSGRWTGGTEHLRVAEAVAAGHVPRMAVYELVREGKLPAGSFGKSFRVPAQAVQDYLAAECHHVMTA